MYYLYVLAVRGDHDFDGEYDGKLYINKSDVLSALTVATLNNPTLTLTIKTK